MHRIPSTPEIREGHLTVELRLDRRWLLRSIDLAPDTQVSLAERSPYFFLVAYGERVHFAPDRQVHFGANRLAAHDFGQLPAGPLVVVNRSPETPARVFLLTDRQHREDADADAPSIVARAHNIAAIPSQPQAGPTRLWSLLVHTDLGQRGWDVGVELYKVATAIRQHHGHARALAVVLAGRGECGGCSNDNDNDRLPVQAGDVIRFTRGRAHGFHADGELCLLSLQTPVGDDDLTPEPERHPRSILGIW